MPIPLIPVAAAVGLGALLFAGSKEDKGASVGSAGASATPTQASTGGPDGGAQMPSHSDVDATDGEVNLNVGSRGEVADAGYLVAPTQLSPTVIADPGPSSSVAGGDAWAQDASPSLDTTKTGTSGAGALGAVAGIAGTTTRAVGQTFQAWGDALGAIW